MTYTIIYWHGYDIFVYRKLLACGCRWQGKGDDRVLTYTGSLDEFADKYGTIFMVRPEREEICVTQHSGFQQR